MTFSPKEEKKNIIKKKCSQIGFLLVIAVVVMNVIAIAMELILIFMGKFDATMKTGVQGIPYIAVFLMNAVGEFSAFFIVPIFFCLIKKFSIVEAIPVNNNKKYNIFVMMIAGYSICVLANLAVSLLNFNLGLFGFNNEVSMDFGADTLTDKIAYFVCVAIVPALTEEFTFRGVILNYLKPYGNGFAILVSSILFGLVHGNFVQIPFAFIVGLVCGYLTVSTGTIVPSVLLHLLNNGTSVILDLVIKSVDESTANLITNGLMFALLIISFVFVLYLINKRNISFKSENKSIDHDLTIYDKVKCFFTNAGIITSLVLFGILAFVAASSAEIIESVQK